MRFRNLLIPPARLGLLAAGISAALALTACGGSADPLSGASSATSAAASAASSAASGASSAASGASSAASGASSAASSGTASSAASSAGATSAATGGPIVVGSADFPENALLANIYAAALTNAGIEATTRLNIGSREIYLPALEDGSINLIPEYTGNLLAAFDETATATDAEAVYTALQGAVPEGLTVLDYSPAEDKDSIVVTRAFADEKSVASIADLGPLAGEMTLGGPPEFATRPYGPEGLASVYGLTFAGFTPFEGGGALTVKALTSDQVQAANVFTTDPLIPANDLVILEDPESLFSAQNVVPLIASDVATPEVTEVLNAVSGKLDTTILTELLTKVAVDKADSVQVAQEWVASAGI